MSTENLLQFKSYNPSQGFKMDGYYVWCNSTVYCEEDGLYHMFASRWESNMAFHPGWLFKSEIVRATSKNLLGPYTFEEVVFEDRGGEYWDGRDTHNPRVVKHNGEYIMFYTGMTYPYNLEDYSKFCDMANEIKVSRASKRIGIATAKSPKGPWIRRDEPILPTKPNTFYSMLTSNASPIIHEDGSVELIFKSRSYMPKTNEPSPMHIGFARAKSINDKFEVVSDKPVMSNLEDPFVWYDKEQKMYHMIAKDMTGEYCGRCDGIYATSTNGVDWNFVKKAYDRKLFDENGKEFAYSLLERCALYFEDGKIKALFAAVSEEEPYCREPVKETFACAVEIERLSF